MEEDKSTQRMIEFREVSLYFDDKAALKDISFEIGEGEMLILTGISGSGKSVLLRLAMGLLKPDAGQILIRGREIGFLDESELLAIRGGLMGMVFQEDALFTGLSVFDNVAFRPMEHGWTEDATERAVKEVLQYVGLDGEQDKFPEELSGGMKRRVEIARALVGWPKLMLFDEPTMSLDPIVVAQVLDLVMRARDINKMSSIYVTKKPHEISYLMNYGAELTGNDEVVVREQSHESAKTRILVLDNGKVIFEGGLSGFQSSDLPAVKRLLTLDPNDHTDDPYFQNPWDRRRHSREKLL